MTIRQRSSSGYDDISPVDGLSSRQRDLLAGGDSIVAALFVGTIGFLLRDEHIGIRIVNRCLSSTISISRVYIVGNGAAPNNAVLVGPTEAIPHKVGILLLFVRLCLPNLSLDILFFDVTLRSVNGSIGLMEIPDRFNTISIRPDNRIISAYDHVEKCEYTWRIVSVSQLDSTHFTIETECINQVFNDSYVIYIERGLERSTD